MNKPFLPLFLILGTTSVGATCLFSQTTEPVQHLETMLVSGTVDRKSRFDFAQSVSVLSGPELAQRLQPTLGDTLAGTPGVDATSFGPGASRPIIRGLGGDRVRVLTGGVGSLDASVVSPDHAVSIEPLLIERVEIVRGPASLLYGGSAIGGVVNVIDGRIPDALPTSAVAGRFEARGNSVADERASAGVLTGALGKFAWRLDGFRRKTDDIRLPGFAEAAELLADHNTEEEGPPAHGHLPNSATEGSGAAFGLSYLGARWRAGVAYSGFDTLYGVPGDEHHAEHDGADAGEEPHADDGVEIDLRQRRWDAHAEWLQPAEWMRAAKFQFGLADYAHAEKEGGETKTDGCELASLGGSWRFVTGRATLEVFARGSNLLDETVRAHASYSKDVAPQPGRNLTAGVRVEF